MFNGDAVIDTAPAIGDRLSDMKMIAVHSHIYGEALRRNEIQFFKPSDSSLDIPTYKGTGCIVDDNLQASTRGFSLPSHLAPGPLASASRRYATATEPKFGAIPIKVTVVETRRFIAV